MLTHEAFILVCLCLLNNMQMTSPRHTQNSWYSISHCTSHCLSLCCPSSCPSSLSLSPSSSPLFFAMRASEATTFLFLHWPVPRCICMGSSLSLQKAQWKKIRILALMKARSTVSLCLCRSLFLSHLRLSLALLPWTWKDERGELNLIQTSSPELQMTGLWSVRVWVFALLFPLSSPALLNFFLWTERESPEARQFNLLLSELIGTPTLKGPSLFSSWPNSTRPERRSMMINAHH